MWDLLTIASPVKTWRVKFRVLIDWTTGFLSCHAGRTERSWCSETCWTNYLSPVQWRPKSSKKLSRRCGNLHYLGSIYSVLLNHLKGKNICYLKNNVDFSFLRKGFCDQGWDEISHVSVLDISNFSFLRNKSAVLNKKSMSPCREEKCR